MRLVTTVFVFTVIEPPITATKSLEFDFHKPRPPRLKNSEIISHFFQVNTWKLILQMKFITNKSKDENEKYTGG